MRIYFENYSYDAVQIKPYLDEKLLCSDSNNKYSTNRIGYLFVSNDYYSGPIFILPKSFLLEEGKRLNVLGFRGVYPEYVINTHDDNYSLRFPKDEDNPPELFGDEYLLPKLGIWLYRALYRFREEHKNTSIGEQAQLDSQLPENSEKDKDFLSTALDLIDFLKDHRNLFTQINIISHSGRNKIEWRKTISGDAFIKDDEVWFLNPIVKKKIINIDDTLFILYYSILKYLRDEYSFPVSIGDVPYELLTSIEVQRLIDTGIGDKIMRRIRHKYFRDELKRLWSMVDSFFTFNTSNKDKDNKEEHLLVGNFQSVFEAMVDSLISDTHGVEDLKKQDDGKLIDHIFRYTSLLGNISDIYYIGDSKYYRDDLRPEGVALYKQFTYARNAIQYHIDNYYLTNRSSCPSQGKCEIRYRDTITEGYNITPNFFIRSRIEKNKLNYSNHNLKPSFWDKKNNLKNPKPNKHFEDRLFDRDTLLLREFSINLLFVIASYAGYEDSYWSSSLHHIIRDRLIESINYDYEFLKLTPKNVTPVQFYRLYFLELNGRAYMLQEEDNFLIIAFERTQQGQKDKESFLNNSLINDDTKEPLKYTFESISLQSLNSL